ncbi:hypothetical protein ASPZODRAFT_135312 [Penicilliopsis zonata CBS 506.65]|uniref:Uncharacterized protein n=1 Tax=Penicilliopsis zonata CBS 506.65 TaxID=1073090 RepID=A0A1L9SBE7_9EURO|nr:hypothetical protein ASPZODRAFT_135312 [Penicilliopsis zonata CBS 506.65]OJJ44502.1 hypothetical protein ASPZODRAFT_135312 [Penicilliopsis zonata CBS 506.65]
MARSPGYVIIKSSIPRVIAEEAAESVLQSPLIQKHEKYTEHKVPNICMKMKDDFMNVVDRSTIASLMDPKPVPKGPNDLFAGQFHETNAEPTKLKTAQKDQVYATIALTDLSPSNGWYTFYEDSHSRTRPLSTLVAPNLKAGDAMVWRGDLVYIHSSGGGGVFLTLVFQ